MSGSAKPSDLHVPRAPGAVSSPPPRCSTGTTPRSTSCGGSCRPRARRSSTSGHDRSVREVVDAVLDEDAQAVAVSSYQGGHVEYFEYLAQLLEQSGAGHVRVFGGGGGVIVPEEITRLAKAGVRIFSPRGRPAARPARHDQRAHPRGRRRPSRRTAPRWKPSWPATAARWPAPITCLQADRLPDEDQAALAAAASARHRPGAGHHRHRRIRQVPR